MGRRYRACRRIHPVRRCVGRGFHHRSIHDIDPEFGSLRLFAADLSEAVRHPGARRGGRNGPGDQERPQLRRRCPTGARQAVRGEIRRGWLRCQPNRSDVQRFRHRGAGHRSGRPARDDGCDRSLEKALRRKSRLSFPEATIRAPTRRNSHSGRCPASIRVLPAVAGIARPVPAWGRR